MNQFSRFRWVAGLAVFLTTGCQSFAEMKPEVQEPPTETRLTPRPGVINYTCLKHTTGLAKTPGHWWIGTIGGLVQLDEKMLELQRVYTPADGLAGTRVIGLAARDEVLWVGTDGGVSQLDTKTGRILTIWADGYRWRFEFDEANDHVWALGGQTAILFAGPRQRPRVLSISERPSIVFREGETLWGTAWVKQDTYQLLRLDTATGARQAKTLTVPDSQRLPQLVVGEHDLWALVESSGLRAGCRLLRIDKSTLRITPQNTASGLAHDFVEDLTLAGPDTWVRTIGEYDPEAHVGIGGRLCRYEYGSDKWRTIQSVSGYKCDEPTCLAELDGQLWMAARSYNKTERMVVAWGMFPMEREAPVVEALTLNRLQPQQGKWETFEVPDSTNYDRIITMALQGNRLWFLLERRPLPQTREGWKAVKNRMIPGYVDTASPGAEAVLFQEPLIPPAGEDQWRLGKPAELVAGGDAVWVFRQDELWRFAPEGGWGKVELRGALPDSRKIRVFVAEGNTWASCADGQLRFDPQSQCWVPWGIGRPWTATDLCQDPGRTLWLAAEVGRISLPKDSERNDEDRKPLQGGLFRSRDGTTWEVPSIAPWTWQQADVEGEVCFLPLEEVKRTPRDTPTWGNAWADRPRPAVREVAQAKQNEGISCVVSDGKRVWVGTRGEGVFCLEGTRWRRLWPKSADGVERRGYFVPPPSADNVASMALDGDWLWIATAADLRRYRISEAKVEIIDGKDVGFRPGSYGPVVAKAAGRIWFSPPWGRTGTGIYCLAEDRRDWQCLIADASGQCYAGSGDLVWIGTQDGLLRYDTKTGQQKRFTTHDGLAANSAASVAADERFIWVGTVSGISRLDRAVFQTR
jgi:hypothetical protein